MSWEPLFHGRLIDPAGNLFGLTDARVYHAWAPQNDPLPYVVWTVTAAVPVPVMGVDSGLVRTKIQLDGYANDADVAVALKDAIRERVQRWKIAGPPRVQDTMLLDTSGPIYDEKAELFRVRLQIELNHEE